MACSRGRYIAYMSKHNTMSFGVALRAARRRAGKSQADLAKYLGISTAYVSDMERGYRSPLTNDRLEKAARYLDADVMPLLEGRAAWHGCVEIPLTGRDDIDGPALRLARAALLVTP